LKYKEHVTNGKVKKMGRGPSCNMARRHKEVEVQLPIFSPDARSVVMGNATL
jgi:hypothetical protein